MAAIALWYLSRYSGVTLCAAGLIRTASYLGNTCFFTDFTDGGGTGGQHALVLMRSLRLKKPSVEALHVEMSGVVIGAAKAAGKLTVL